MTEQQVIDLQKQLLEAQQKLINLHEKVEAMTPKQPMPEEIRWHLYSDGVMSDDLLETRDIDLLKKYHEWMMTFGEKHIQPYVHPYVYSEIITQMGRGILRRLAELEVREEYGVDDIERDITTEFPDEETEPHQPPLISDD